MIVKAATALFAAKGIDGTSMRDIADGAGVREAAIYRHFASKDDLAREIFLSWYGWYCHELQRIASGSGRTLDKLREMVIHEFSAVTDHSEAFVYFCENEARFARSLPSENGSARSILTRFIKAGQAGGEVRAGSPGLLADMLSGALCAVALTWHHRGRRNNLNTRLDEVVQGCWRLIGREVTEMTPEEQLIQRYFDAFNRHDIEGVMACYHEEPVIIGPNGKRCAGRAEVRRSYETEFAIFPDGHCDLRVCTGNSGHGVAESFFHGTDVKNGKVEAIGAEVMEIVDGKIKELRDYHHLMPAKTA